MHEKSTFHPDLYYTIALLQTPSVGDKTARTLIAHCGSAKAVFETSKKDLAKINTIGAVTSQHINAFEGWKQTDAEMLFLEKHDITPFLYHETNYPSRLKYFDDSPTILYQKGTWNANKQARIVGIIGTRKPTSYGVELTERLVEALKPYNVTVISGLAYGIDIAAHRSAVSQNIPTVGVLAHGLSRIYPPEHRRTAEKMYEQDGALLTEFPSYVAPDRENFPRRNRIVAGLCDGLVVVETARKGGSMITATIANGYNKDVCALPGRAGDPFSAGCNFLIKSHQAALIENVEDLAYTLGWDVAAKANHAPQPELFVELDDDERRVLAELRLGTNNLLAVDELAFKTQLPLSRLAAVLLGMEFRGIIQSLPGKRYAIR